MILLPVPWKGMLKLLIVLEDDNIERIKSHDCAEVIWSQLGQYRNAKPESITIGYANPEEIKRIYKLGQDGGIAKAIEIVVGGFKYRPEAGDHDLGPSPIGGKKN